jgi:biotin carboxylase
MAPFRMMDPLREEESAVVIVTPYSTGCCIAQEVKNRGHKLICLWSKGFSQVMKTHVPLSCEGLSYDAELEEQETLEKTAMLVLEEARLQSWSIVAVLCGGEAGVDLTDALSEHLGLLTNGTDVPNRRDKKVQQELVKKAGLRSVRQASGSTFEQVETFLRTEQYPVILKPVDSAGSDGVKLCRSFEEAKEHFQHLMEVEMVNGGYCEEVLCQEYLKGREYVVDHVSLDGVHKTCMVWMYDKRPANGADFVYYGDIPVDSESPEAKALIPYARGVLDALGIKNGPTHGEIILTEEGPCLVEMNCRALGGDGLFQPLCRALTGGYNQVDATVDVYLDSEQFDLLPDKPPSPFLAAGQTVDLVSHTAGTVKATPGFEVIKLLPSFIHLESHVKDGTKVVPTVDMATELGCVLLMHPDKEVLKRDIALIRQMENNNVLIECYPEGSEKVSNRYSHRRFRSCSIDEYSTNFPAFPNLGQRRILSLDWVEPKEMYTQ